MTYCYICGRSSIFKHECFECGKAICPEHEVLGNTEKFTSLPFCTNCKPVTSC